MQKINSPLYLFILLILCLLSRNGTVKGICGTGSNPVKIKIVYQFRLQASKNDEPFFVSDTMALEVDENYSVYYDLHQSYRDSVDHSLFKKTKRLSVSSDLAKLEKMLESRLHADKILNDKEGETARIFKKRFIGEITTIDRDDKLIYKFKVVENISFNWEISADTMTVLNYVCMKATTDFRGRTYTAWFAPDIPVSDGPWKFYGLPGMILKVEDSANIFTFESIGLESIHEMSIGLDNIPHSKVEILTYKQFNDYKNNSYKKISVGFYDKSFNAEYIWTKNPAIYPSMEIE